jgi:ribosomal protein S18 acetylase RimI-like enzyme
MQEPRLEIRQADLDDPRQQHDVRALTAAYALDPMGNAGPLPTKVLDKLIPGLRRHPTTRIFLAYFADQAVGIATCFLGFSTFAAQPVLNLHDLAVLPGNRRRGIGKALLEEVQRSARDTGCAKVTLEVQEHNARARRLYEAAGFTQAAVGSKGGGALFYSKPLLD